MANEIAAQTGADLLQIVPEEPYGDDYDVVLNQVKAEQEEGSRPAMEGEIENFDQYEVVYVGFPTWWGDMPMILYTFFDTYDFEGKTIVPFGTSGGSGFSGAIGKIQKLDPKAEVLDGLALRDSQSDDSGQDVSEWLEIHGLAE